MSLTANVSLWECQNCVTKGLSSVNDLCEVSSIRGRPYGAVELSFPLDLYELLKVRWGTKFEYMWHDWISWKVSWTILYNLLIAYENHSKATSILRLMSESCWKYRQCMNRMRKSMSMMLESRANRGKGSNLI